MKDRIKQVFKVYKYLSVIFFLSYWIYIVVDDYIFIEKYWQSHWLEYLGLWTFYFFMYFIGFSSYFWIAAVLVIIIYLKCSKAINRKLPYNKAELEQKENR